MLRFHPGRGNARFLRFRWPAAILLALAAVFACSVTPSAALQAVPIGTFVDPVHVVPPHPASPHLLFVVERRGTIQILYDERRYAAPYLDIRDLVLGPPDPNAGSEQGLLSVAFAPDHAQSGLLYVFYTNASGALEIDEFRRSTTNPVRADRTTRRVVLVIPHPIAKNHNGGQMQFGADGMLYVSTGDGGNLSPPGEPARDLNSLLGKILRINPKRDGALPYGIPANNPFVGRPGRDEIFAYGLRNPWRFSIDWPRIAIGDVGQQRREEVNLLHWSQAAGANFGWPQYEGGLVFDNAHPGPHPPTFPIFVYGHIPGYCAIVGGFVVRDPSIPALAGRYLYGDACSGDIRSFFPQTSPPRALDDRRTGIRLPGLSSFGQGYRGQIYFAQLGGMVSRLEP